MRTIELEYQNWLFGIVSSWVAPYGEYENLIRQLYSREFTFTIDMDENRYREGKDLRLRFSEQSPYTYRDVYLYLDKPCSVLEMMTALAIRCDAEFTYDFAYGYHPEMIFVKMLTNLGLMGETDENYSLERVNHAIDILLNHEYNQDGTNGALFISVDPPFDFRNTEIWWQMNCYLNEQEKGLQT